MSKRLFIISNRLPVTVNVNKDAISVTTSSGGLVSAISSYLKSINEKESAEFTQTYWVGMAGCGAGVWEKASGKISDQSFSYLPVFINKKCYEQYYNGFSNSVIWPLFHYFPSYVEYHQSHYLNYLEANNAFLLAILKEIKPGDVIWIHDYHLMPLARMIREHVTSVTIGFFLHIPFPSYELFRIMPTAWQEEIVLGLLGADLIGFHTIDYASHFLTCVQMILGMDNEMHVLRHQNRLIKVDVFPISIDFNKFHDAYDKPEVIAVRETLKERFKDKKVIFSVDRLDYTKGVSNRLKAFEYFLKQNPQYIERVVFILVIVPSRDSIVKYAERKRMIDEYIGHFNSSIGTVHWQPIIYQYNSLGFDDLVAMYSFCDLALITPLRDGMNLVAKEFIASRKDQNGVLVLSEMAGAARELTDALTINPNDIEEVAVKIKEGLEMDAHERSKSIAVMQQRIKQYDVNTWAEDFLSQLNAAKEKQKEFEIKFIDRDTNSMLLERYTKSTKRLLLLDYDGTLIPFSSMPDMAIPDGELLDLLKQLSENEENKVYLISGRDSGTLDSWFGNIPVNIIAEHGAKFKTGANEWRNVIESPAKWKEQVEQIMEIYVKRCVNSFVESKDFSVAWHYRNANAEQGKLRASELYLQLEGYTNNLGLQVIMGNKVIEVRSSGVNKGNAVKKLLKEHKYDFILCCGDDTTDEDMFRELASVEQAFTIKIGQDASFAKYNLETPETVILLLKTLNKASSRTKTFQPIN